MSIAPRDLVTGLRGTYRVEARHRQGSFGVTYDARDTASGRRLVLKELRIEKLSDWKALELFEREGRVLSGLSHPNIPAFSDFFLHGGPNPMPVGALASDAEPGRLALVLVQEFIEGVTLEQRVERGEPLLPGQAKAVLRTLLGCLTYLHGHTPPLVHRDIKPGNIILTPSGRPYLVDFGAIQDRLRHAGAPGSTIVGTLGYMPLEQVRGDARPASDLYALGVTLIVALAGRPLSELPFDDRTGKVSIARAVPPETPKALRSVLDAMIEPMIGRRPQSAEEVLSRLDASASPGWPAYGRPALAALGVVLAASIAVGVGLARRKGGEEVQQMSPSPPSWQFGSQLIPGTCSPNFPVGSYVQNGGAQNALIGAAPTEHTRLTAASSLLNIDFGSDITLKAGVAAAGATSRDVWNPVGPGSRTDYVATGFYLADGTHSRVVMRVQNLPGNGAAKSLLRDPMVDNYSYSTSGSSASIAIAYLPAGLYDFYIYATAPGGDAAVSVATCKRGTTHPALRTGPQAFESDTAWVSGGHYVLQPGVDVDDPDLVLLTLTNGVQGTGNAGIVLNGIQIVLQDGSRPSLSATSPASPAWPLHSIQAASQTSPCPAGSTWNGRMCAEAPMTCRMGTHFVAGQGCVDGVAPPEASAPFDRGAAAAALGAVSLVGCRSFDGPNGAGHVSVTFAPDGTVSSAIVDQRPFAGTAAATCISNAYRRIHVPAFAGASVKVGKSFVLN